MDADPTPRFAHATFENGVAPLTTLDVGAALLERWRSSLVITMFAVLAAGLYLYVRPQRYEAAVTLSPVLSTRNAGQLGAAASLLGAGALTGGFQATPALIVRLAELPSVLLAVAATPIPGTPKTVIEALESRPRADISVGRTIERMQGTVAASYDRETGLVVLRVVHRDSTVARLVTDRLVTEVTRVFRTASRAQAAEQRQALTTRVDSAARQLAAAEQSRASFLGANRSVAPFSPAQAEYNRLERAVELAQGAYTQSRGDRETAIGKELEDAPAVVVLDPLPRELPTMPAPRAAILLLAAAIGVLCSIGRAVLAERRARAGEARAVAARRLRNAAAQIPLMRIAVSRAAQ